MVDDLAALGGGRSRAMCSDLRLFDLLMPPAVMLTLIAGVLIAGRSTTSPSGAAVRALLWFGVVAVISAQIARRRPATRMALAIGYVLSVMVAVTLLGLPSLLDREVSEFVATGTPHRATTDAFASSVELWSGTFTGLAHPGTGRAAIVEAPDGRRVLTLTGFATSNGPDLRVYLSSTDPTSGELDTAVRIGALKGNRGDQQYDLPAHVDPSKYPHVVVWSRAFAIGYTSAVLTTPEPRPDGASASQRSIR